MISLSHLLENPDLYKLELQKRFKDIFIVDKILEVSSMLKPAQEELEKYRFQKNRFNEEVIKLKGDEKISKIAGMKVISEAIGQLEIKTRELKSLQDKLIYQVPNLSYKNIPIGKDSDSNVITNYHNQKPVYDFTPLAYYDLPVFKRDYLSQKGVEAAGFRGYYMVRDLAKLYKVIFDWVGNRLAEKGFEYVIPPVMVKESLLYGTGFFPSGIEDCFAAINGDTNLYLPGTSEAALMFLYSNNNLDLTIPKKLTAQTKCFRGEIGSYGLDTKGGFRVHEFEKIETVYLSLPSQSDAIFDQMANVFRETMDQLGLHYIDLEVCSGDISIKNNRQIDIEGFFPSQNKYRELCSASNCTDYQTRNLNIKTIESDGSEVLAHSLNCTGITGRTLLCILEQFQNIDGSINIPQVLQKNFGAAVLKI
jgi:seryl-tRNA synthetase